MAEESEVAKVTLGKKEFTVPEFYWRDLCKFLPMLRQTARIDWENMEESDMTKLGDLMFFAVSRPGAERGLTREEFDVLPISMAEFRDSMPIISKVAGAEAKTAGEAKTETPSALTS
jgi:hypothetical protein